MAGSQEADATEQVKDAAARFRNWDPGDIEIGTVEALDRGGCRFYRASNPSRTDSSPVEYATMPDGSLIGGERESTRAQVGRLLEACGADASADWWAQVVSRYAGSGGILVNENAPSAIRKLKKAGVADHAPMLRRDGTATVLRYYSYGYDSGKTLAVTATLDAQAKLSVESEEVTTSP